MGKLAGKVAVVTGASKGIGAGIAKELAAQGASVVVNYASSKEGAEKVVAEITKAGGKAVAVGGSVAKAADIEKLFAETKKAYGKVDVLVNNAGVYSFSPVEAITEEEIDRIFNTNVKGLLLATKAGVALFPPEGGSVINIGSVVERCDAGRLVHLQRHEGRSGCHHPRFRQGTGAEEDSRKRSQPRTGHDGGLQVCRFRWQ